MLKHICGQLQTLSGSIIQHSTASQRNAYVRYSFLLCCYRIQMTDKNEEEKEYLYSLLYQEWRMITRIISVFSGFIVGCELPNFASLTANMKSHLEFAHLYVKAAETEKGRKNKYCGKSGVNQLHILEAELLKQQYERNSSMDELYAILVSSNDKKIEGVIRQKDVWMKQNEATKDVLDRKHRIRTLLSFLE
ncbi:hypothetical protein EVA_18387 [gut metagenome]|uniref:Uncharacterized protein n=1 Tax=gut metagenome TaxID=749906 RepID=J9FF18_9ZZZZ